MILFFLKNLKNSSKMVISPDLINNAGIILNDTSRSLAERFHALFLLRNFKDNLSVEWICKCFSDPSALLKHELAYCLGQMENPIAIPKLVEVLEDEKQEPMVRHEAGEALAAIGDRDGKFDLHKILSKFINDPIKEVAETCQLAIKMIEWKLENNKEAPLLENQSKYNSIDPTPAAETKNVNIEELGVILIDQKKTLWDRYKALFALRNLNADVATKKIAAGLFCEDSALFRHEVAYVLGQIQSPVAIDELKQRLCMPMENGMVRHECAEALGSIATEECLEILRQFLNDEERVVRESCQVALEIAKQNGANE